MTPFIIGWIIAIVAFISIEAATIQLVSIWFMGGAFAALQAENEKSAQSASSKTSSRCFIRQTSSRKSGAISTFSSYHTAPIFSSATADGRRENDPVLQSTFM